MTVREILKKGFDKSGMTYGQFAEKAGISLSSVHKKLRGDQVMTLEEAERYARILGVSIYAKVK